MAAQMMSRPFTSEIRTLLGKLSRRNPDGQVPTNIYTNNLFQVDKSEQKSQMKNVVSKHGIINDFSNCLKYPIHSDLVDPQLSLDHFLYICQEQMGSGEPFERKWLTNARKTRENLMTRESKSNKEVVRVMQWNCLSQTLGTKCDNFVACTNEVFDWPKRRFRMLHEMVRYSPDIICLQEVEHFDFFKNWLGTTGFASFFMAKPNSPCLNIPDNNGPDGCAIFFNQNKFELIDLDEHVLEVFGTAANQVLLSAILRSRETSEEFVVSTTHLKARKGQLLTLIRSEQSKDLVSHIKTFARGRPLIVTGDFNAEPTEPTYSIMTKSDDLSLASAYCDLMGCEPSYTSWKFRDDGEHIETLDYIFFSKDQFLAQSVLEIPSAESLGQYKLPNLSFPSDHLTLVCDFKMTLVKKTT